MTSQLSTSDNEVVLNSSLSENNSSLLFGSAHHHLPSSPPSSCSPCPPFVTVLVSLKQKVQLPTCAKLCLTPLASCNGYVELEESKQDDFKITTNAAVLGQNQTTIENTSLTTEEEHYIRHNQIEQWKEYIWNRYKETLLGSMEVYLEQEISWPTSKVPDECRRNPDISSQSQVLQSNSNKDITNTSLTSKHHKNRIHQVIVKMPQDAMSSVNNLPQTQNSDSPLQPYLNVPLPKSNLVIPSCQEKHNESPYQSGNKQQCPFMHEALKVPKTIRRKKDDELENDIKDERKEDMSSNCTTIGTALTEESFYHYSNSRPRHGEHYTVSDISSSETDITVKSGELSRILFQKRLEVLDRVAEVQRRFLESKGPKLVYNELLRGILDLMNCEFGFISEVKYDPDTDSMCLHSHSTTTNSWDPETIKYFETYAAGLKFHRFDTLFGHALTSKKPVISNNPTEDPRRGRGCPVGHPILHNFLGVPFFQKNGDILGMIAVANKPGGFKEHEDVAVIEPFTVTAANLVQAYLQLEENNYLVDTIESNDQIIDALEKKVKERTKELERANDELALANIKVTEASAAQLKHFACMSHEIRTPLNCIIGLSSLLLEQSFKGNSHINYSNASSKLAPTHSDVARNENVISYPMENNNTLNPFQEEAMQMIVTSGDLLLSVVNDVLDYSKLQSGSVQIDVQRSNLHDILNGVIHSISMKGLSRSLNILPTFDPKVPHYVTTDPKRLQQILYNLLGNAIKFSPDNGTIELQVKLVVRSKKTSKDRSMTYSPCRQKKRRQVVVNSMVSKVDSKVLPQRGRVKSTRSIQNVVSGVPSTLPTDRMHFFRKLRRKVSVRSKKLFEMGLGEFTESLCYTHPSGIVMDENISKAESLSLLSSLKRSKSFDDIQSLATKHHKSHSISNNDSGHFHTNDADDTVAAFQDSLWDNDNETFSSEEGIIPELEFDVKNQAECLENRYSLGMCNDICSGPADCMFLRFQIKDYGVGIAENDLHRIFEPFAQATKETERLYGGTGLGLPIVSRLVNALGGLVNVASVEGKWSEFTVDLPFHDEPVQIADMGKKLKDTAILVLDHECSMDRDDHVVIKLLKEFNVAASMATIVTTIGDFMSLVRTQYNQTLSNRSKCKTFICLIHEDFYDVNTYNALQDEVPSQNLSLITFGPRFIVPTSKVHFRNLHHVLPIVLMEAFVKAVGTPLEQDLDVSTAICELSAAQNQDDATSSLNIQSLRILIAEDNVVNQKVLLRMLQRIGIENVDVVEDGKQAVERESQNEYDLILMDMQMPVMDGIEATKRITASLSPCQFNQRKHDGKPKIVFVTAHAESSFEQECLNAGAHAFLTKPFTIKDIKTMFHQVILKPPKE